VHHVPDRRDAKNKSNYSAFPSTLLMNGNRSTQSPRCIFSSIVSGKRSLRPFSNNCFVHFPATMTKDSSPNRPRRFAPLNPEKQIKAKERKKEERKYRLKLYIILRLYNCTLLLYNSNLPAIYSNLPNNLPVL